MTDISTPLQALHKALQENRIHDALKQGMDLLEHNPRHPDVLFSLALIAFRLQQAGQALQWLDATLEAKADFSQAWLLKARVLRMLRRPHEAIEAANEATRTNPRDPDAWHCAGFMKMAAGLWDEACQDLGQSVQLNPHNPVVRSQYALALCETNAIEDAYRQVDEADRALPSHPEILMAKADILEAAGYYDIAKDFRPTDKIITFGQAASLFLTGHFREGLALIVARNEAVHTKQPQIPVWNGEENFGLHLLLTGEQGYGDIIQFLRYVPLAKDHVGKITLRMPRLLQRLVQENLPDCQLLVFEDKLREEEGAPAQDHDLSVQTAATTEPINARSSLMALPLRATGGNFTPYSESVPYLKASEEAREAWRAKLPPRRGVRIGLTWAGNPHHKNDHKRSMPPVLLVPLMAALGDQIILLQKGREAGDFITNWIEEKRSEKAPATALPFDAAPFITDFYDSAALLCELDLLISIDSAPAHLAGALGVPVWTLLPFAPDWRWLLGREDTLWYPQMRLFRQTRPGDWPELMERVTKALNPFLKQVRNEQNQEDSDEETETNSAPTPPSLEAVHLLAPPLWEGPTPQRSPYALPLLGFDLTPPARDKEENG